MLNASLSRAPATHLATSMKAAIVGLTGWDQQLNRVAGGIHAARQATPSMQMPIHKRPPAQG